MRYFRASLFGLLSALIVGGGAFAVTSGGFPSRPIFQSGLYNGNGNNHFCSVVANNSVLCTIGGSSGAWGLSIQSPNVAGNSNGVAIVAGTNSSDGPISILNAAGTSVYFKIDGAGNITTPNAASTPWPKVVAATVTNTGTSCSIFNSSGGTVTCTFNSTTSIKVNLPFNFEPACTTTAYGAGVTTSITSPSASSMTVGLSSGATNFSIVCVGDPN